MMHELIEASEIIPNLWQGSVPPTGPYLRDAGFDLVVLCAREWQYEPYNFPGVRVVHAPNDDSEHLPLTRAKLKLATSAAKAVASAVSLGKPALVTCAAGLNRSGLVTALALHFLHGWSGEKCIETVRTKRQSPDGFHALFNQLFCSVLMKLPDKSGDPWVRNGVGILVPKTE